MSDVCAIAVGAAGYFDTPEFGSSPPVVENFSAAGNTPILFTTAGGATNVARNHPDLVAPDGRVVARGLVNYDSDELPSLLGRTTRQLTAELGEGYDRTAVHRDALIVLAP